MRDDMREGREYIIYLGTPTHTLSCERASCSRAAPVTHTLIHTLTFSSHTLTLTLFSYSLTLTFSFTLLSFSRTITFSHFLILTLSLSHSLTLSCERASCSRAAPVTVR